MPVLSVQIIVAEPNVSTTFILDTIAFRADIFCMPNANVITKIIGNPSGTIATNMTTAIMNCSAIISFNSVPVTPFNMARIIVDPTITIAEIIAIIARYLPNEPNLISRGVFGVSTSLKPVAISPTLVSMPVLITTPNPRPEDTTVPMNAIFVIS